MVDPAPPEVIVSVAIVHIHIINPQGLLRTVTANMLASERDAIGYFCTQPWVLADTRFHPPEFGQAVRAATALACRLRPVILWASTGYSLNLQHQLQEIGDLFEKLVPVAMALRRDGPPAEIHDPPGMHPAPAFAAPVTAPIYRAVIAYTLHDWVAQSRLTQAPLYMALHRVAVRVATGPQYADEAYIPFLIRRLEEAV
ncbi:hypothetical protein AURDEDRAFT_130643 [Auricularia subglabra TFB-10046 SS5]|uniref:Uncharacterized protein n=1 Tax=Auricularia subglabra (strain TFB-10046 / SS5) TaxID=717982 RepID=J0WRQ4_AURST|nr:hypothetical protein AURDEDRAFT_130643 [Auricularia subglabra TFB-10046 SS5]